MSTSPSPGIGSGRVPARIAGLYAAFGLAWIWMSDSALIWLGFDDNQWFLAGAAKGTIFVTITAVFLYWLVRREVGAARRSEGLLRAVVEGTTDAVFVKDVDGRYLLFNEAASAFVGKPVAEVLGRDDTALFNSIDAAGLIANDRAVMGNGKVLTVEETITADTETRIYQATKAPLRDEAGHVVGLIGISRDITDAKRASQSLRESEQRFRSMADAAPVLIWLADTTGGCVWFNRQWLEFVGRPLNDELGAGWVAGVHPEDRSRCLGIYQSAFDSRQPFVMDYRLRRHDGEYRWVLDSGVPRLSDGEFVGYIGSCVDITDRKVAEDALKDSENRLRTLADAIPQIVWTADRSGALTHVNTETALYTGLDALNLVGWGWEAVIHPDDLVLAKSEWAQTVSDGIPRPVEMRIRQADGDYRWYICRQRPIRNAAGQIESWVGTNTDIDDLKQAENALRETDVRLREAQRIARLGSWAWEPSTNRVWWSDAEFELFGVEPFAVQPSFEEFLAFLHPDDRPIAYSRVDAMLSGANEFANDLRVIRPNGETIWIHSRARATRDSDGMILRVEGTDQDVTARRLAELAAQASERQLQSAIEVAELGIIEIDLVNESATLSPRAAEQFGLQNEVSVSRPSLHAMFHPDDRQELERLTAKALDPAGTGWFALEHRIVRPDGTIRWLNVHKQVSFNNKSPYKAVVVAFDVTSRRLAEEALRASESRYRAMFESSPHPMWVYSVDSFRFLAVNDAAVEAYGYTRDEFLSMSIRDIRPDDEVQRLEQVVARLTTGPARSSPWRHKRKDGTVFDVDVSSHDLSDGDGRTRLVMALDITERLQAEKTRDELLARLQLHIDRMPLAYVLFDANMHYANWNPAAERIFGYTREEAIGQSLQMLVHPEDRTRVDEISARLRSGDVTAHSINRNLTKDGRVIVCEWHNTPLFDTNGAFLGVLSMTSDITDRVRSEEALRESERRLRLALEAARAIVFTWDIKRDVVTRYFSTKPAEPVTARQLGTLNDVRAIIHQDDLAGFDARLSACIAEGTEYRNAFRVVQPDGASATLEEFGYLDRATDGTPLILTGISIDISDRIAAIDALRVSEERLRVALQGARGGVWDWDLASGDVWWSPEVYELMGAVEGADTGAAAAVELILECDRPLVLGAISEAIAQRKDYHCEFRVNGGRRWLSSQARLFCNPHGEPLRLLGITWDITDRMFAMEALQESESRYRRLVAVLPTAVLVHNGDRILYCNPAFVRMIGAESPEVILDKHPFEFVYADDRPLVRSRLAEMKGTAEAVAGAEIRLVRYDGRIVPTYSVSTPISGYGPQAFLVATSDLTERERATQLLRSVLSSVSDAILTMDERGVIGSANPAALSQFNCNEDAMIGSNIKSIVPQPNEHEHNLHPENQLTTDVAKMIGIGREIECLRHDGTTFSADLTVTEFRLEGERHFTGVLRDITERQKLQAQFIQAQKMEAVGRLAGGVAHDFNNLLTIINGYSDLLLMSNLPAGEHVRESIAIVRDAGERAARLTQQLLAFSRKAVVEPKIIDLNDLVSNSARLLRRLIGEDIILAVVTSPKPIQVKADPGLLEQVIMNLFVNARDAMPTGGRLTIETTIEASENNGAFPYARLTVRDTGHGMPDDIKEKIFEPFFTTKGIGKGTGLGLAVVHGVVTQSGGQVKIESSVGGGTTFQILLPLNSESQSIEHLDAVRFASRGNETILLVEDEEAVRKITSLALKTQGYSVIEAEGGAQAIRLAETHPGEIHLMVSDVVMPEMGGRQLLDAVRRHRTGLRVLFMSGYTDDAILLHGVVESTDAFIQKPFTPLTLARKVREVIDTPSK